MTDDTRDLTAAAAGDEQAFARLYDRHAGVVMSLCRRRALAEADAEDAVQETFIRAHKMLRRIDHANGFRPWLYGIAKRVCAERHRAANRRIRREEQAMICRIDRSSPTVPAWDTASKTEQLERLGTALDALPDEERLVIHLYYLDDDPVAAATSALGVSRSAFYKLLARARKHLARLMREVHTL